MAGQVVGSALGQWERLGAVHQTRLARHKEVEEDASTPLHHDPAVLVGKDARAGHPVDLHGPKVGVDQVKGRLGDALVLLAERGDPLVGSIHTVFFEEVQWVVCVQPPIQSITHPPNMAWKQHPSFVTFLQTIREHNALLTNPVLMSVQSVLDKKPERANLGACQGVADLAQEKRINLFVKAVSALHEFGLATKGTVTPADVDAHLESLASEAFVTRLVPFPRKGVQLVDLDADEKITFQWAGVERTNELFVMFKSYSAFKSSLMTRLGNDMTDEEFRTLMQEELQRAGLPVVDLSHMGEGTVGYRFSRNQLATV